MLAPLPESLIPEAPKAAMYRYTLTWVAQLREPPAPAPAAEEGAAPAEDQESRS